MTLRFPILALSSFMKRAKALSKEVDKISKQQKIFTSY